MSKKDDFWPFQRCAKKGDVWWQKVTKSHKKSQNVTKTVGTLISPPGNPISSTWAVLEVLWCIPVRHIGKFDISIPNVGAIVTFLSSTSKFCDFSWKTDQHSTGLLRQKEVSDGASRGRSAIGMARAFRNTPIWPPKIVPTACQSCTKTVENRDRKKN